MIETGGSVLTDVTAVRGNVSFWLDVVDRFIKFLALLVGAVDVDALPAEPDLCEEAGVGP